MYVLNETSHLNAAYLTAVVLLTQIFRLVSNTVLYSYYLNYLN